MNAFSASAVSEMKRIAQASATPGLCVVAQTREGQAVLFDGEDWAGSGQAVGPDSWFQLASTVKHVTACVVLDLARQGLLSIDRPVGDFVPDLPRDIRDRSIGSLLHHTSGLPEYLAYIEGEQPPANRAEFLAQVEGLPNPRPEGEYWSYSNTNYILLGLLVAELTGAPCGVAVDALLASRVGAAGARAASPEWARDANARRLGPNASDQDSRTREIFGDGDVAFTAAGALGWLKALLEGPEAADAMLFTPGQVASGAVPYGCGWFLESVGGDAVAHHAGHYDGWTAMAYLNRSRRCGVIAMSNLAPGNTRTIRAIALQAMEDLVPGSTPLAQQAIDDGRPDLTARVRQQLFRQGYDADPKCFAPAMRLALDLAGAPRGMLNLWTGVEPEAFDLVEHAAIRGGVMRRYRIRYADRIEHLHVQLNDAGQISWVWPL